LAAGQPHPEILSNLGAAYVGVGDYEKAIGAYQRALQLQPASTQIHFNLGLALYKANLMEGARDEFLRVLGTEPTNTRAAILLADVYFRFGENGLVVQTLEPFRAQAVSNPAISYLLGTALIRENRVEEGQVFINEITRQGDSAAGHMMMGTAHMMAGESEQATNEFREAISRDPKLPGVHSTLGSVLFSLNKPEEARSAFQKELENNPNDFEANFYLASLLHEDQRFKEALPFIEKARLLRPGMFEAQHLHARILLAAGLPEKAREMLESLVEDRPDYIEAHVALATAYHRLQMTEQAKKEQEIIVRLSAERDAAQQPKERRIMPRKKP